MGFVTRVCGWIGFGLITFLLHGMSEPVDLYRFQLPEAVPPVVEGQLEIGPSNPDGPQWGCNDRYITKDGQPFMPVMAEFHFSRYPAKEWDEQLMKIKAGGVDIVATYLFWIHHEEEEGVFDFTGQRDIRRFIELCQKHDLQVWVRLGPWCHGEVRNGGFPDWLRGKFNVEPNGHLGWAQKDKRMRSNDPAYIEWVDRLYGEYGKQCRGLMVKDGGPIVGVQVENEYSMRGEGKGEEHIELLLELAKKHGFDVPFYSVTGWHNAPFPKNKVIPMFGGYPARPWSNLTGKLLPEQVYRFELNRDAGGIGTDIYRLELDSHQDLSPYPLMTCEIGVGNEVTDHRRPWIGTLDGVVPPFTRLGIGAACIGYYVYHGGTNPEGKLSTLQESTLTGYPNDCPVKSYDFQAAIRESGRVDEKYFHLRKIHYFMHDFGTQLAPTIAILPDRSPEHNEDFSKLRMALRTDGETSFLFVNNHVRGYPQPDRYQVQFALESGDKTMLLPREPVVVPSDAFFIWPVGLKLEDAFLRYSTAEPVMVLRNKKGLTYVFAQTISPKVEYQFDVKTIMGDQAIFEVEPGTDSLFKIETTGGKEVNILTLTNAQALQASKISREGEDYLVISQALVIGGRDRLSVFAEKPGDYDMFIYPSSFGIEGDGIEPRGALGVFDRYELAFPEEEIEQPAVTDLGDDKWKIEILQIPKHSRLRIEYQGDTAELYLGGQLIYDNFYNGEVFEVSLDRFREELINQPLVLEITPMPSRKKLYLDVPKPSEKTRLINVHMTSEQMLSLPLPNN